MYGPQAQAFVSTCQKVQVTKGMHISSDIMQAFQVSFSVAERIKVLYGGLISTSMDDRDTIQLPGNENDLYASLPELNLEEVEETVSLLKNIKDGGAALTAFGKVQYTNMSEKEREIIKFFYFSELGDCGENYKGHQKYCDGMLKDGYSLVSMTPLGDLDVRRDSYEGTLVYHWKLVSIKPFK